MRLTSIWTIRGMSFAEKIRRSRDVINLKLASLIPKRVLFWAYIRAGSQAMGRDQVVPDAKFAELLDTMDGQPHS